MALVTNFKQASDGSSTSDTSGFAKTADGYNAMVAQLDSQNAKNGSAANNSSTLNQQTFKYGNESNVPTSGATSSTTSSAPTFSKIEGGYNALVSMLDAANNKNPTGETGYAASLSDAEKENAYTQTPKTTSNPTSLPTTDGNTTSGNGTYTTQQTQTADTTPIYSDLDTAKPTAYTGTEIPNATAQQLSHVDTTNLQNILKQISDAATQQNNATIDNSVQNSINELNRALEDAGIQYDTQRNQIATEERTAMDNQALYNQARGDNGGIGAAQYAAIQNNAATNRRSVNLAQTQLSTDTARQISDLRAQGEFEKADALLTTTQSYLSQLMSLEQWALETNMSVDEFNTQLQQWQDEYNMQVAQYKNELDLSQAQLTGYFANGTRTASAQNELSSALASSGSALLSAGIMPNTQQLEAMGMSESQAQSYISKV